ncbi:hypothetical protein [Undibacterium curvum]|uniref:hypothetical protein n=1 Tax=Undibacterium curvum TaxID=2762294 RepID=UPI003D12550B
MSRLNAWSINILHPAPKRSTGGEIMGLSKQKKTMGMPMSPNLQHAHMALGLLLGAAHALHMTSLGMNRSRKNSNKSKLHHSLSAMGNQPKIQMVRKPAPDTSNLHAVWSQQF